MRIIRDFGQSGRIQVCANESGTVTVEIGRHLALDLPTPDWEWSGDYEDCDRAPQWCHRTVWPADLGRAITEANMAADAALAMEQRAVGAVESLAFMHEEIQNG